MAISNHPGKLALLLLLRRDLNHPRLWESFVGQGGERVRVYAHSKPHVDASRCSPLVAQNQIAGRIPTQWGDISLVYAMLALLRAAMQDPSNQAFAFASESCIPVRVFEEVYDALVTGGKSWINAKPAPALAGKVDPNIIAPQHCMKSGQWISLNRADAQTVIDECPVEAFHGVFAVDELFAATTLAMVGRDLDRDVARRFLTYSEWREGQASPQSFERVDEEHVERVMASHCLFARKYPVQSDVDAFVTRMLRSNQDSPSDVDAT